MTREEIYDEQIAPLMTQIIATCKEHDIPMVASFDLDDDRDDECRDGLACTTMIVPPNSHARLKRAASELDPRRDSFAAFTITTRSDT